MTYHRVRLCTQIQQFVILCAKFYFFFSLLGFCVYRHWTSSCEFKICAYKNIKCCHTNRYMQKCRKKFQRTNNCTKYIQFCIKSSRKSDVLAANRRNNLNIRSIISFNLQWTTTKNHHLMIFGFHAECNLNANRAELKPISLNWVQVCRGQKINEIIIT